MEVDQIQCKFPRISNGYRRLDSRKLGQSQEIDDRHYPDDEEEGENTRKSTAHDSGGGGGGGGGAADPGSGVGRFYGWPSSRIVRVSRATGGKDRHSKVLTSKGPRDRRVRLSVNTAIQFYDLQDRLGYDQPSKAVEWLLAAAAAAIAELPPMSNPFAETPKQLNNEKRSIAAGIYQLGFGSGEMDIDIGGGGGNSSRLQPEAATKSSGGSSNSETSKGSGISISRSESRIKARERAKERAAEKGKERREKEKESNYVASFTELLSGRNSNCINGGDHNSNSNRENRDESSFFVKSSMDYFTSGLLGPPATRPPQFVANSPPLFSAAADHHHHPELQPFNFSQENLVSAANSPGVAALNRGTLQSNSPPPPMLPRFPPADGSPPNFFGAAATPVDSHHHFFPGFDARLQLFYGNAHGENGRHFGQKEKEKN